MKTPLNNILKMKKFSKILKKKKKKKTRYIHQKLKKLEYTLVSNCVICGNRKSGFIKF